MKFGIAGISIVSAYIAIVAIQLNITKITHLYAKRLIKKRYSNEFIIIVNNTISQFIILNIKKVLVLYK